MSSITPPHDDDGVQRIRSENVATPNAKAVSSVAATRGIHPPAVTASVPPSVAQQRRLSERRRSERRQQNLAVLLDTRSHRERRKTQRQGQCGKGIDIKV